MKSKVGRLRIIRPREFYAMARALVIKVDTGKVGKVGNNSTFDIDLPVGDHIVTVHMDWCQCPPYRVTIEQDEVVALKIELNGGFLGGMFYPFIKPGKLYTLKPAFGVDAGSGYQPYG